VVVGSFKLAINMAGAVSAGAYTAGVLDFLFEALDQWYRAKAKGEDVPAHDVSIETLSGASAGGMCAAIAAVMLQGEPDNRIYEAWVNAIDIRELLKTQDVAAGSFLSLLDSTVIGEIAKTALTPGTVKTRNYVSPHLTLFLTVTNLRGVPYALFEGQTLTPDEYVTDHADSVRFELVDRGQSAKSGAAHALTRGVENDVWSLLRTSAMATGAFPAFLAPRVLHRSKLEYAKSPPPAFPKSLEDTWTTVNVDGGVTNNSPFVLASDYLAALDPPTTDGKMPSEADRVDRAVLTIAPFPGNADWNKPYDVAQRSTFFGALGSLASTLLSQSRFFGESMAVVAGGPSFGRFFIAPSGEQKPVLQCGLLGAFGGFFERSFRAHDFQLGRRNCQRFLETSFLLPDNNPLFSTRGDGTKWLPIIPLLGTAKPEIGRPQPGRITRQSLKEIVDLMEERFHALLPPLLAPLRSTTLKILIGWSARMLIATRGKKEISKYLERELNAFLV
jgi:predicted acylesterase/phospholipase RssA